MHYENDPCTCHGFDIIGQRQNTKYAFDAAGTEGLISFIRAQVASGMTDPDAIIEEAVKITGVHIEKRMRELIRSGDDRHWTVTANDLLQLPFHYHA